MIIVRKAQPWAILGAAAMLSLMASAGVQAQSVDADVNVGDDPSVDASVSVGGGGSNGTSANGSVGVGTGSSTNANANLAIGNGSGTNATGNVAVGTGAGGTAIDLGLGVNLNLGGLMGPAGPGGPGGPGGGSAGPSVAAITSALGDLSAEDLQLLQIRCDNVLKSPGSYSAAQVTVCQVVASL